MRAFTWGCPQLLLPASTFESDIVFAEETKFITDTEVTDERCLLVKDNVFGFFGF